MFVTAKLPEGNVWPPSQNSLEEALALKGRKISGATKLLSHIFFIKFPKFSTIFFLQKFPPQNQNF